MFEFFTVDFIAVCYSLSHAVVPSKSMFFCLATVLPAPSVAAAARGVQFSRGYWHYPHLGGVVVGCVYPID